MDHGFCFSKLSVRTNKPNFVIFNSLHELRILIRFRIHFGFHLFCNYSPVSLNSYKSNGGRNRTINKTMYQLLLRNVNYFFIHFYSFLFYIYHSLEATFIAKPNQFRTINSNDSSIKCLAIWRKSAIKRKKRQIDVVTFIQSEL